MSVSRKHTRTYSYMILYRIDIFGYSIKSVLEFLMFVFNFKTIFKQTLVAVLDLANFVSEVKNYYGLNLMNTFVTLESE